MIFLKEIFSFIFLESGEMKKFYLNLSLTENMINFLFDIISMKLCIGEKNTDVSVIDFQKKVLREPF